MPLPERPRAVITGAAGGLGRALALEIGRRRGRVLVADIDESGARETVNLVAGTGAEASAVRCDVSKIAEVEALAACADERMGGADLLVNNAGVGCGGNVGDVPLSDWEWIMGINLWGVIYGCHTFVPRFRKQGSGHILNVASVAGLISAPLMAPYNVTKAGVVALSQTLANEVKEDHIGVTVLCPTYFNTRIVERGRTYVKDAKLIEATKERMARAGVQADGVAKAALDAVARGDLYALPHRDGRWFWRLMRAEPELFYRKVVPEILRRSR
jgi:NAD(P)-dependent dehydrogenase (short-subunit alcohol dehydrogenase family)